MSALQEALDELAVEIGLLEGAAHQVEESSREVAGLEEQIERFQRAAGSLASSDQVLRSLTDAGSRAAELILAPETIHRLSEVRELLDEVEEESDSLQTALAEAGTAVEDLLEEQVELAESLLAQLLQSQEAVEGAFASLTGALESTRETALSEAAERIADLAGKVQEVVEEHFEELPTQMASSVEEALEEALQGLGSRLVEAAMNLAGLAEGAFSELREHAESGIRDAVEEEVAALADSAIETLAREAIESVGLSQLSAAATSALSPILPQLIAIRIIVNGLKRALEILRLGL